MATKAAPKPVEKPAPKPKLKRNDSASGPRTYDLPPLKEGDPAIRVPSVTSILSALPKQDVLVPWAAKRERELVVAAAARVYGNLVQDAQEDPFNPDAPLLLPRKSVVTPEVFDELVRQELPKQKAHVTEMEEAAAIGTAVHAAIEAALLKEMGRPFEAPPALTHPAAVEAFARYERWRAEVSFEPVMAEEQVWSRTFEFAGTLDFLAHIKHPVSGRRILCLGDWKTSRGLYPEHGIQNAAYILALAEMGHVKARDTWGAIVRLPKVATDPGVEIHYLDPDTLEDRIQVFLSTYNVWKWKNATFLKNLGEVEG